MGILKPSTVPGEGGLWDPPPQGPCTRSGRCFPLPRPPDPCSSYQAEVGQRTGRSLGRGSQGSQVRQSQKRKQEIRRRQTGEAVSSAGGGKALSARRTQVEVSQHPRHSPGLYPVPPLVELTQRSIALLLLNHPSCRNTYFPNKTLYQKLLRNESQRGELPRLELVGTGNFSFGEEGIRSMDLAMWPA